MEKSSPRLWKRLSRDQREEVELISRIASTTQEFANSGFPEGTNHGLNHIVGVFSRADELVAQARPQEFNSAEALFLVISILLHDLALFCGRDGHADATKIIELSYSLNLPIDRALLIPIARVAAAHSGKSSIEQLPAEPIIINSSMQRVNLRAVAATLRLSDEIAEDSSRTSVAVMSATSDCSSPYHEFSHFSFCGFDFSRSSRQILIQIACESDRLSGRLTGTKTLLDHFLDHCLKIEIERRYCARFLPPSMRIDSVRLRILEDLSTAPWLDCFVPGSSTELHDLIYRSRPELLLPSFPASRDDLIPAFLERYYTNDLISVIRSREVYFVVLSRTEDHPESPSLQFLASQVFDRYGSCLLMDVFLLEDLLGRLALGDPNLIDILDKGSCLLGSRVFDAACSIISQPLIYQASGLLEFLTRMSSDQLDRAERAQSTKDQLWAAYRCLMMLAQILCLRHLNSEEITLGEIRKLGDPAKLMRLLSKCHVPTELRRALRMVARDFGDLKNGSLKTKEEGVYLGMLYDCFSFASR